MDLNMLTDMLKDIEDYKSRNKNLSSYVNDRLSKSLLTYYKDLNDSVNYLSIKDSFRIARGMNKYV